MPRLLAAALVALATGAAALTGLAVAPATATSGYCTGAGVNVLVDPGALGGGLIRACAPQGAGGSAWNAFEQAGVSLTPVQRYPGAVCRVDGRPADAGCVNMPPADAYWGFFTSRGQGWTYASVGPDSYRVANGDTIAFAWQASSSKRAPAAAPATPHRAQTSSQQSSQPSSQAPSPAPSRAAHHATTHTTAPPRHPTSAPAHPAGTATPKASAASSGPSRSPARASTRTGSGTQSRHRVRPHRVAAPTASAATTPTAGSADPSVAADPSAASATPTTQTADTTSGVPWWAPVLILVVLAGAGGAVAWRRRTGLR